MRFPKIKYIRISECNRYHTGHCLLGFGFIKRFLQGFIVVELASLGALFLGLLGAVKFSGFIADLLNEFFDWSPLAVQTACLFLSYFIIIVYAISVLAKQ